MGKKLPKSIIKKYGISKKAWRVFRAGKSSRRTTSTRKTRRSPVTRRRTMPKFSRAKELFLGLNTNELIGGFGYAVAEPMIDQFTSGIGSNIPIVGNVGDDVVKLVLGLVARKYTRGQPMLKGVANSMVHINMYKVAKTYAPNIMGNLGGTASGTGTGLEGF